MEIIELIQTNPELGGLINEYLTKKQALEARPSQHSSAKMKLNKSNDSKGSKGSKLSTSNLSGTYTSDSTSTGNSGGKQSEEHEPEGKGTNKRRRSKRHSKTHSSSSSMVLKSFAHRFWVWMVYR